MANLAQCADSSGMGGNNAKTFSGVKALTSCIVDALPSEAATEPQTTEMPHPSVVYDTLPTNSSSPVSQNSMVSPQGPVLLA